MLRSIRLVAFDFDGVFTDNAVWVSQSGEETVRCWRSDGLGIKELARLGVPALVISTESNPVVTTRARKLRLPCVQNCENKLASLEQYLSENGFSLDEVAFTGNDINDLECLQAVRLPIIVQDAHPDVWPSAMLRTTKPGGYGAVREICDWFRAAYARSSTTP